VLFLGAGYWIAITIDDFVSAVLLFFVAVTLVIIGTYLLFIYGSTVILTLLQKKRRYYYQTNHFLNVSTMKYRLKQNATSLASIAILSRLVLVTLSSTWALFAGSKRAINQNYPADHTLVFQDVQGAEFDIEQLLPTIQTVAKELGMDETSLQQTASRRLYLDDGFIMTLYDANQADQFGLEPMHLEANQAIALGDQGGLTQFDFEGKHFDIIAHQGKDPDNAIPGSYGNVFVDFTKNGLCANRVMVEMNGSLNHQLDDQEEMDIATHFE
ncbi:ABC transporter, permease protein, partial [gut metagenome]